MSPPHLQSDTNARWYKVPPGGTTSLLNPGNGMTEGSTDRVEWLFGSPEDPDQSITIKELVVADSGLYRCESVNGSVLSVIQLIVEGKGLV